MSNIEERLNLYKELNNFNSEGEITTFKKQLEDRFGTIPDEIHQLFDALRLRWLGKKIGFTRIILKSGKMRAFFTNDKTSTYFESPQFSKVLNYLKNNFEDTQIKEKKEKFSFEAKNVSGLNEAIVLSKNLL